jgi:hypothetical protein
VPPRAPARRRGESPRAPWGSFPLVELCILVALGLSVAGILIWGQRGQLLLAAGVALGSLVGLEVSIREHFAGYRSHTTVLAGTAGVAALAVLFFVHAPRAAMLAAGAAVFAAAFYALRIVFRRRSGGVWFRS